ncbi:MAG: TonB-dependent receptor, partial [Candidatus Zixiibacteriota bacterium]
ATYFQDKIEFQNMIANVGLRFDYTDRSGTSYTDPFSSLYELDSLDFAPTAGIKPYFLVSPRVGISHPISSKSKLFFNYGHFYDEPKVEYLYIIRERENGYYDYIPNGELKPQKTIAYELGFDQQIGRSYLLHISGFYRDISDEIQNVTYINKWGVNYRSYNNDLYEDVRGIEALFEKKVGDYLIGSLSYDYLVSSAGYIGNSTLFENTEQTPIETGHIQYTNIKYNFLANITFRTPSNFSRSDLLNSWNLNFTHEHRSGPYMTYNPEGLPGVVNNLQWRPHLNTNMRLSKAVSLGKVTAQVYFEVYNLFNRKELTWYMRSYLLPQQTLYWDYIYSLDIDRGDRPGDYRKDYIILPDPEKFPTQLFFINPRRYFFGIHINI